MWQRLSYWILIKYFKVRANEQMFHVLKQWFQPDLSYVYVYTCMCTMRPEVTFVWGRRSHLTCFWNWGSSVSVAWLVAAWLAHRPRDSPCQQWNHTRVTTAGFLMWFLGLELRSSVFLRQELYWLNHVPSSQIWTFNKELKLQNMKLFC